MFERGVNEKACVVAAPSCFRPMPGGPMGRNVHVLNGIRAISQRPEYGVGVGRIDVLAHRHANLSAIREQRRGSVQAAPDFGLWSALLELHEDDLAQV
jgi:hypothetical protein